MRRLVLALVPLLLAATWYVRKDGSDSLCSGQTDATGTTATSPLCAYRSVGKALSASSASDTITIHAGIYYESLLIDKALTIQGATGETVWIRAGSPATETAGNAAWTLVDATRGEYISTGTFPGFANDPFGFVMDVPGVMETGNFLGLVTYGDNRATTGKACRGGTRQGFVCTSDGSGTNGCPGCFPATGCCKTYSGPRGLDNFRATSDVYVGPTTPLYVGPGIWGDRLCSGGGNHGQVCDKREDGIETDCPGGTCTKTGRIRIRLAKTADMRAFEAMYGKVFWNDPEDPNQHAIMLSYQGRTVWITAGGVTLSNLSLGASNKTIEIACTSPCSSFTFDNLTVWTGTRAVSAATSCGDRAVSDVTVSNSRIHGPYAYWIFWSDTKNLPKPSDRWQPGSLIDLRRGSANWTIHHNLMRGGFDGFGTAHCESGITARQNRIEYLYDDAFEVEANPTTDMAAAPDGCSAAVEPCPAGTIGAVSIYENIFENAFTASATGQSSGTMTGDQFFYRNIIAFLRDAPVNRKIGLRTFNGGFRYGHEVAFKTHTFTSEPTDLPRLFYYHNTVILQNSGVRGTNLAPHSVFNPPNADTRTFGNIFVKVNGPVHGALNTGSPCSSVCIGGPPNTDGTPMLNYDLLYKFNPADPLLIDSQTTTAAVCTAKGLECNAVTADPKFTRFKPGFNKATPTRWAASLFASSGFLPSDFSLQATSPARGATTAAGLGNGKSGTVPDSCVSSIDAGALPYGGDASCWTAMSSFPFNERWVPDPAGSKLVGSTAVGVTVD